MLDYIKTVLNGIKVWVEHKIVNPDWNVDDPDNPAYVKNRTHYEAVENVVVTSFAKSEWQQDKYGAGSNYDRATSYSPVGTYIYGDKYTVIYDGDPYEAECVQAFDNQDGVFQIGFGIKPDSYMGRPDSPVPSGETPFILLQTYESVSSTPAIGDKVEAEFYVWIPHEENPKPHTFEIRHKEVTLKQLDDKFFDIKPERIRDMYYQSADTTEICSDTYLTGSSNPDWVHTFVIGKEYLVVYDDEEYYLPFVATNQYEPYGMSYYCGFGLDDSFVGKTYAYNPIPSGEVPFVIFGYTEDRIMGNSFTFNYMYFVVPGETAGKPHTISIFDCDIKKVKKKYLPRDVANAISKINPCGSGSFSMNRKSGSEIGSYSHAVGYNTTASGYASHAEGNHTASSSPSSHSEGVRTSASGEAAHAEGCETKASNDYSHAEGWYSEASGTYAHAEGWKTSASGKAAHAEGHETIAASEVQHVEGRLNIEDTADKYIHIVGNGRDSKRSNAHTLDWEGNAWYAGKVYVGGTSQDDAKEVCVIDDIDLLNCLTDTDICTPVTDNAGTIYADENGNVLYYL